MSNNQKIYLSPPHMSGLEMTYLKDAFESNWIAPLGPHVNGFEKEFAEYHQVRSAAAVSSGTAALHLILRMLSVTQGDSVICSSFTFIASATPILYQNATPVFIDSETESWNMDPELLQETLKKMEAQNKLPKAVIVVHLYGQCANMDPIIEICNQYNIPLIEDAAEALGASYKNQLAGTLGKASIFSFNGNKIITTSGGGMLISNDEAFVQKARFLSTQARDDAPHYEHSEIGYNYRMSNLLAAVGRGQLKALDERVLQARTVFKFYCDHLSDIPGIAFMPEPEWSYSNRWLTCITVDPEVYGATREDIRLTLEANQIESRPLWKPMHMQSVFKDVPFVGGSVSEQLFQNGLCLPSGTSLTEPELTRICQLVRTLYKGKTQIFNDQDVPEEKKKLELDTIE